MPSQYLQFSDLWDESKQLLILDEFDAKDFAPEPVTLNMDIFGKWIRTWPELKDVLDPFWPFFTETKETDDDYLADAELYEKLAPLLPDQYEFSQQLPAELMTKLDYQPNSLPDGRVANFLDLLYREREAHLQGKQFISRIAAQDGKVYYHPEPDKDFLEWFRKLPAVLLNSTAHIPGLTHILETDDYPVSGCSPNVRLKDGTSVTYILDNNHSKTALMRKGPTLVKEWQQKIRRVVSDSDEALVVATADGERLLENAFKDLKGKVHFGHYVALSGRNEFNSCDTVVLAQPFNPPGTAVAGLYRRVWGGMEGTPLDVNHSYRVEYLPWSDGAEETWEIAVNSVRDDRLAEIHGWWRWSEMYQAAHRVRPIRYARQIVVLCAIPLPGLKTTHATYKGSKLRKFKPMRLAAERLIRDYGRFSQQQLADAAGVHLTTVNRNWDRLIETMGLTARKIYVPGKHYHKKGRSTIFAVDPNWRSD